MNKFKMILFPVAMFIWISTLLLFITYSQDSYELLQEKHLNLVVNYATDAAVNALVESTTDLGLDHTKGKYIKSDPDSALQMFCVTFLKNYGKGITTGNMSLVKSVYLKTFCVAVYDGYYIAEPTMFNSSGGYDMIFGMKQPYLYQEADDYYALNLGLETATKFSDTAITKVEFLLPKNKQMSIINNCVSDDLMSTIYEQENFAMNETIYLPTGLTNITRTNPIENVTVLAYISDVDVGVGKQIKAFGIGGARVTQERFVACYQKEGKKYYTYTSNVTEEMVIDEVVENPKRAAEKGYMYDLDFFMTN